MHDAVEAITGETAAEVKGSAAEKAGEVALVEAEKEVLVGQQETTAEKVVAEAAEEAMEVEEAGIIGSVRAKCCDFIEPYLIIFIYPDGEYKSTG